MHLRPGQVEVGAGTVGSVVAAMVTAVGPAVVAGLVVMVTVMVAEAVMVVGKEVAVVLVMVADLAAVEEEVGVDLVGVTELHKCSRLHIIVACCPGLGHGNVYTGLPHRRAWQHTRHVHAAVICACQKQCRLISIAVVA